MPDAHELTPTPPRVDDPARADDLDPGQIAHAAFRSYHRATRRSRVRALAGVAVLGLATVGSVAWLYSGSQPQPAAASLHSVAEAVVAAAATATPAADALPTGQANPVAAPAALLPAGDAAAASAPGAGGASGAPETAASTTSPTGVSPAVAVGQAAQAQAATPPAQLPTPLPDTGGPPTYSIAVTATGYQAELDQCQWVRMNIGASAPIVGAHTKCGGAIVVDMQVGQTVTLTGQGLDGSYTVSGSRDAHAGDDAATATAGMGATVILQTCYPIDNGSERLVALVPA